MREVMTHALAGQILAQSTDRRIADIFRSKNDLPFTVQKIVLDLTTARLETDPYVIKFPFRSFYVQETTDSATNIFFKPVSRDSIQSFFTLKKNDAWVSDSLIGEAFLHWDAQSGDSITLVFFTEAEFRSGSLISVNSGGVSISDGSAISNAVVTLAAGTAGVVFASSTTRKLGLLQNNTGASIWLGPSTVDDSGANLGLEIQAGDTFEYRNSAALYAISTAGGDVLAMSQTD